MALQNLSAQAGKSNVSMQNGLGTDYGDRLQTLIAPVNLFLAEAEKNGVGFELYLHTFSGGSAGTYHALADHSEGESASALYVSRINPVDSLAELLTEYPEEYGDVPE